MIYMITLYFQIVKDLLWMQIQDIPSLMDHTYIKGKAIPVQGWAGPEGSRRLRVPDFEIIGTRRWWRLSYSPAAFTPQEILLALISVRGCTNRTGHRAVGRTMSMKKSSDTIGNRTCDLLACSAVPQPLHHCMHPIHTLVTVNYSSWFSVNMSIIAMSFAIMDLASFSFNFK